MERAHVSVQGDRLILADESGAVTQQLIADLAMVQVVSLENGLFQGEEPFFVLVFPSCVWVIPDEAAGLIDVWKAIRPVAQSRTRRVVDARLPWRWRKKVLGVFPLFPLPRMGAFDAASLPKWPSTSTMEPEEYDALM